MPTITVYIYVKFTQCKQVWAAHHNNGAQEKPLLNKIIFWFLKTSNLSSFNQHYHHSLLQFIIFTVITMLKSKN